MRLVCLQNNMSFLQHIIWKKFSSEHSTIMLHNTYGTGLVLTKTVIHSVLTHQLYSLCDEAHKVRINQFIAWVTPKYGLGYLISAIKNYVMY